MTQSAAKVPNAEQLFEARYWLSKAADAAILAHYAPDSVHTQLYLDSVLEISGLVSIRADLRTSSGDESNRTHEGARHHMTSRLIIICTAATLSAQIAEAFERLGVRG